MLKQSLLSFYVDRCLFELYANSTSLRMLINKVFSLLSICLIEGCYGRSDQLPAISFLPGRIVNAKIKNNTIELQPNHSKSSSSREYTLCLRVNFLSWNTNYLITSRTIMLYFEKRSNFKGTLSIGEFQQRFSWENLVVMSYTTWYSFCLLYSAKSNSVSFFINGKEVANYYNIVIIFNP